MSSTRQCCAGDHEQQLSDWAALPVQLLRQAFESQNNGLDNCAAACVCTSWKAAVNSSFVKVLHLHISSGSSLSSSLMQWRAYLAAQSSIGELNMTAGDSSRHALPLHVCDDVTNLTHLSVTISTPKRASCIFICIADAAAVKFCASACAHKLVTLQLTIALLYDVLHLHNNSEVLLSSIFKQWGTCLAA